MAAAAVAGGAGGGGAVVQLRDSKHPHEATLSFVRPEWRDFIEGVKLGEFDRTG